VNWLKALLHERSQNWFFGGVESDEPRSPLIAGATYVNTHLNSFHLEYLRRGTKKFHGVVGASFELASVDEGTSRFSSVLSPDWLAEIDRTNLDRVVIADTRILGPRPYVGGEISVEVGLFARPETDLAAPFVKLLTTLSDVAGVALAASAGPLAPVIEAGIELLFGNNRSALEIGAFCVLPEQPAGTYAAVRNGSVSTDNSLMYNEKLLTWKTGELVLDPFIVFTVSGSRERADWASIPDIRRSWEECRSAIRNGQHGRVSETLAVFRRTVLTSAELLLNDARRLVHRAEECAKEALGEGPTGSRAVKDVPLLESLDLFADR
jgi:hypothetical protein